MILFFYSRDWQDQYEYAALQQYIREHYDPSHYLFSAIEDLNLFLSSQSMRFYLRDNHLQIGRVRGVYLLGLGHVTTDSLSYRISALAALQSQGLWVINSPEAILTCRSKLATYLRLHQHGVPFVPTLAMSTANGALCRALGLNRPLIKPLSGSGGFGIARLPDGDEDIAAHLASWRSANGLPLAQPYLVKKGDADIRILVVGAGAVAAMRRRAAPGALITNIRQGGSPAPIALSDQMRNLALAATSAVEAEIATVDLLEEDTGALSVLEVNGFARWQALQSVTDLSISGTIAAHLMAVPTRNSIGT